MARVIRGVTLRTGNVITGPKKVEGGKASWKPALPTAADLGRQYAALAPMALKLPSEVYETEKATPFVPKPKRKLKPKATPENPLPPTTEIALSGFVGTTVYGKKVSIWKKKRADVMVAADYGNGRIYEQYKNGKKRLVAEIVNGKLINDLRA